MRPIWLGAYSPGGLALPDARPSPSQLYAPRGVYLDDDWLVAADSGNHRILLWRGVPEADRSPACIVLGQPDFSSEGVKLLHLPTGVLVHQGRLVVADSWHHRVLVWHRVPEANDTPPDYAIGQPDLESTAPGRGARGLYWPYGIGFTGEWFWIADTGNRRVLGWRGLPQANQPAEVILGQPSPDDVDENRGGPVCARSFRWPHAIAGDASRLLVADAGNHRVLAFEPLPHEDCDASGVMGQPDFSTAAELPYIPQGPARLRFPYGIAFDAGRLAIADTANNRVLVRDGAGQRVLGQDDFNANGENRWKAVTHDSLCWPYGIWLHRDTLAIADSGNNRLLVWNLASKGDHLSCASPSLEKSNESMRNPAPAWAK